MTLPGDQARDAVLHRLVGELNGPASLRLAQEQVETTIAAARGRLLPEHAALVESQLRGRLAAMMMQGLGR